MRIRTVKPEFWTDALSGEWSARLALFFIGLWGVADDAGRLRLDARLIRAELDPFDSKFGGAQGVEELLEELVRLRRVLVYEAEGQRFGLVAHFAAHQRIDKPTKSRLPTPPEGLRESSRNPPGGVPRKEGVDQGSGIRDQGRDQGAEEALSPTHARADAPKLATTPAEAAAPPLAERAAAPAAATEPAADPCPPPPPPPPPAAAEGTIARLQAERERAFPALAALLRAVSAEAIPLTWPKDARQMNESASILGQERALEVVRREHGKDPSAYAGWYAQALYRAAQLERRRAGAATEEARAWWKGLSPEQVEQFLAARRALDPALGEDAPPWALGGAAPREVEQLIARTAAQVQQPEEARA